MCPQREKGGEFAPWEHGAGECKCIAANRYSVLSLTPGRRGSDGLLSSL